MRGGLTVRTALVMSLALVMGGLCSASATAAEVAPSAVVVSARDEGSDIVRLLDAGVVVATPQTVAATAAALDAAGLPSVTANLFSTQRTTYTLPSGSTIVVERPRTTSGTVTPQWSITAGWGLYIHLNQSDQRVLIAGGAAALGALICGSTGLIACVSAAAVLAAAAQWLLDRGGICTGTKKNMEIRIWGGTTFKCVK